MRVFRLCRTLDGQVTVQEYGVVLPEAVRPWELAALLEMGAGNVAIFPTPGGGRTLAYQGPDGLYYCDDLWAEKLEILLMVVMHHPWRKR